jgi:hypothetical protein
VQLVKACRANARHCLAMAKKQQAIKERMRWLEKASLWLELARQAEDPMKLQPSAKSEGVAPRPQRN